MAIAIFPSLEGGSLEDFSIRLADRWRVGQKGLDNGVILVVFVQDRKVRFEVGYGLEPLIPDAVAGRIIREHVAPRFREGRYAAGLEAAAAAVYSLIQERDGAPARGPARGPAGLPLTWQGLLLVGVVIVLVLGSEVLRSRGVVPRRGYTATRRGWEPMVLPGPGWGRGRGWGGGGFGGGSGGGGFTPGGGGFGGGGASGDW